MELFSPKPKTFLIFFFIKNFFLYFRRELLQPQKQKKFTRKKFLIFFQKRLFSHLGITADQTIKQKIPYTPLWLLIKRNTKKNVILQDGY